jgi:hypothetical protein
MNPMQPVMNDAKWKELRLAMYGLGAESPRWRTRAVSTGFVCEWDQEWFYHFSRRGYEDIEWLEINTASAEQRSAVLALLKSIHVPGHMIENGFRVYGHVESVTAVEYI